MQDDSDSAAIWNCTNCLLPWSRREAYGTPINIKCLNLMNRGHTEAPKNEREMRPIVNCSITKRQ